MSPTSASTQHFTDQVAQFRLRFPIDSDSLDQDQEWCEFRIDGETEWNRIRFHDYHQIYDIPGLYEALFYQCLKCCSPYRVVQLLNDVLMDDPHSTEDLRVLDLGAGNGMVGQELRNVGVQKIVGIDIIPEAREATYRDRPGIYDDYVIADMTDLDDPTRQHLRRAEPNCLTTVAALGYGDIPAEAFVEAYNLIDTPGWLAFNIKQDFLDDMEDETGFAGLIRKLMRKKYIEVHAYRRYCHRLSIHGEPLFYVAMVARKLKSI